jgi:endonuclease/exonuclease/phosphatase family metal-dependent hydrolase
VQLSQSQSEDLARALTNQPHTGGYLYASFRVNFSALPNGAGTYFAHFKDPGTLSFRAKVFATTSGAVTGRLRLGAANAANTPAAVAPMDLTLGSNYTVVLRYAVATPATTLWINPASEASTANRADAADAATTPGLTAFALRQSGSSPGMGVLTFDDLIVATSFAEVSPPLSNVPPAIAVQPASQAVVEGSNATFAVTATGTEPLHYAWQFNGTNVAGATGSAFVLTNVTPVRAGVYSVTITNLAGITNSEPAILTVNPRPPPAVIGFSLLTYNTHGALIEDWSTNAAQVQAIGRQLQHLQPDIVTFQEIPYTNTWQMPNWVAAYLPGYALATNSGTDGFIRSVIASRFPITRSQKWLDGVSLSSFGYDGNFTRDLFEAQIAVPDFPQPLHVFTTHLKSGQGTDDSARRAAEANAISNFFVTGFLTTNGLHPYLLTGDLNEDIARPPSSAPRTLERLTSAPTGLRLTTPLNPWTGSEMTFSIRAADLTKRYDYVLPCALLVSNVASSQVFRTDLLTNPPPPLLAGDSETASDHLPVQVVFNNPYDKPFRLASLNPVGPGVALTWESVPGQPYFVEVSSNLSAWSSFASDLLATNHSLTLTAAAGEVPCFFRVCRIGLP